MAERAIAVDDQPRVATQHQRGIQVGRKAEGDIGCAGIPRNVLAEPIALKPQGMESSWDPIGRVIADQQRVATTVWVDRLEGRRFIGPE
jgi:hypothetical protein